MQSQSGHLGCVVVTRNRFLLLQRCLHGLLNQTRSPESVSVIDNGSEDETVSLFQTDPFAVDPRIDYVRLEGNSGGAGGFHAGIARAIEQGVEWIWVMDDDACPEPGALDALLQVNPNPNAIYAAAALCDTGDPAELVWPAAPFDGERIGKPRMRVDDLPATPLPVVNAPFIGMLIHRDLIARIGLPDADFFVSFEDGELCARACAAGGGVFLVRSAVVRHPRISRLCLEFARRQICLIQLAPWRRYYDTRNRLVIAKRYYGRRLWTEALPGTLLRWLVTLVVQADRLAQSAAFARGIFDALTGRMGIRWPPP